MHRVKKVCNARREVGRRKGGARSRKGKMEKQENMWMRAYSIVSNMRKGMREGRGKAKRDIEGEGLDSPLRRKMGVIGGAKSIVRM
jgi:hypothetical protein